MRHRIRPAHIVAGLVAALLLSGCFRFGGHLQGVQVRPTPPGDPGLAFCHRLDVTVVFGVNTLFDTTFTVGDDERAVFESPDAPTQRHYDGMPLAIDVACYDADLTAIGESHHLGHLRDHRRWADVGIFNYSVDNECVPATRGTGTQVCVVGERYDWD